MIEIIDFQVLKLLHSSLSDLATETHQPKCKQNCATHYRSQNLNKGFTDILLTYFTQSGEHILHCSFGETRTMPRISEGV